MTAAIAVAVVLAIAGVVTWLGAVVAERRHETSDLARPVSRQALERLRHDGRNRNGTRW